MLLDLPKSYILLEGFARVLSHKLRGPLSVIQNDLTYLQSLVPQGECTRSLERCRQITNLLRENLPSAFLSGSGIDDALRKLLAMVERLLPENIEPEVSIGPTKIRIAFPINSTCPAAHVPGASLTGFFCLSMGLDFIEAPICEALFCANNWDTTVNSDGSLVEIICRLAETK